MFLKERHVGLYILFVRKSCTIAFAKTKRAMSLQLDAVHAEILKIELVFIVAIREIEIAYQTKYDSIQ